MRRRRLLRRYRKIIADSLQGAARIRTGACRQTKLPRCIRRFRDGHNASRREARSKPAALAGFAFDFESCLMTVQYMFHDRKAQTGAARFARAAAIDAIKALGEPRDML